MFRLPSLLRMPPYAGLCAGLVLLWLFLLALPGRAEDRMALVVGNSSYSSVTALDNPARDAKLMAEALEKAGFDVTLLTDASQTDLKRAIAQFGRSLRNANEDTVGLFYYAGHGVQSFGNNYLLPVDVALSDAADLDLMAVEAQSVLRQMASARNKANIVILDACRNNPFASVAELNDNGLAEMKAPTGTYLAYATAPGGVALDGEGGNSPFTAALAEEITTANDPIEQVFKTVRRRVLELSEGRQTPWDSSSLVSDFIFIEETVEEVLEADAAIAERALWALAQQSRDPVQIMLFLRSYGDSLHAAEARALLAEISATEQSSSAQAANSGGAATLADETQMFEAAHLEGSVAALRSYLQSFPQGRYAELAEVEIAALQAGAEADTDLAPPPAVTASLDAPLRAQIEAGSITFDSPLASDLEQVHGRSLAQLIEGSPLFPPVAGLPESYWKDQTCSNCHNWTREALCTQARNYLTADLQRSVNKQHPYGGGMKQALRSWAQGDCP